MANKPPPPDQNILVYVQDYDNSTLQATVNSRKNCRGYEGPRCETAAAESTCSLPLSDSDIESARNFNQEYVAPPYGWKRIHTKGIVVYVSPSNTPLSSTEQVKAYLLAEGTCKCGLECPVNCETTFNFNPKVLTRPWTAPALGPGDLNKLCNHKRKLLSQSSFESIENKFADDFRKKKRRFGPPLPQPHLPHNERGFKEQEHTNNYNGLPWRDSNQEFPQEPYSNGYQLKYEVCGNPQYQKVQETNRFGSPNPIPSQQVYITFLGRQLLPKIFSYNLKLIMNKEYHHMVPPPTKRNIRVARQWNIFIPRKSSLSSNPLPPVHAVPTGLNVNRTPPWQQNKTQTNSFERVPTFHQHNNPSSTVWNNDLKKKQTKFIRKRYSDDNMNPSTPEPPPSFMEDPSGYLAQQTALLNSTISRQSSPAVDGIPLPSSLNKYTSRPKCKSIITSRFPDSSVERRKPEEPSSTLPDKNIDDRGPIQGTTVSTSNRSPVEARPPENVVTTMASGHTASSNTITSVLAGKANTATVSVSNPGIQQKPQQNDESGIQQDDVRQILVPSPGQLVVANSVLPGQSKPVINQPTVLLPGPLLLQPSVVVDGLNTTLQIPQIVGNVVQNQVLDDTALLSPESKRKANLKKRKLSPTIGSMLLSPQGSNNVMVQQQQLNAPMLQALTILPGKTGFTGTQQLITTNMLQPLNLVQNFPIQQFIVPTGVGSMVMSDGTILQDTVQLNLLTPVQNTGVFSNGQNLLTPGMVIRTPSSQSSSKVIQNNQFLNSPNQFVVNNAFTGPVSPLLNVSPTQCNRSQDFLSQNVVVQQPSTSNTTVVQQNTTIVQQTTMVSNQQTQPTPTLNLNQNFILNDKPNFILTSEKQNFILSPNNDKIIINPENMRANFVLGNVDKQNFVINNMEKQQNLIINNYEKNYIVDKKNSVSTQTQVASPGLYRESPPDTTTLSPVDQEVTTSLQPTSPQESLPMVHCVSSSSHHDDHSFSVENYLAEQCEDPSSRAETSTPDPDPTAASWFNPFLSNQKPP
ncbi:unnamed protein product [Nezara viridula]|uniref:MBD domain-containing protein n=1 Tax=Nezara viridula TaxID=85310 RepID=A0A9P0HLQ5_NEZVI|nr:unnamed protein product [Nezara viridula]